jgi:hypothetical protein
MRTGPTCAVESVSAWLSFTNAQPHDDVKMLLNRLLETTPDLCHVPILIHAPPRHLLTVVEWLDEVMQVDEMRCMSLLSVFEARRSLLSRLLAERERKLLTDNLTTVVAPSKKKSRI